MSNFIEKFYYGNIEPQSRSTRQNKTVQKEMKKKYYMALDEYERRIIINSLNEMRNRLITSGKYIDAVDEVLLKAIEAKQKKFKVIYKEA